jgi:hypothetical protein
LNDELVSNEQQEKPNTRARGRGIRNMDQPNVGTKRATSSNTSKVTAKTHEAAAQVKEVVAEQANQLRDRAVSAKEQAGDRIRGVATQLRGMSDTLRQGDPLAADVAERASQGVESVARYVSSATPQSFIRDTEQLARRQPALFYGAAFLLGLAAGRFIKSSRPEHEGQAATGSGWRSEEASGGGTGSRQDRSSGFFSAHEREDRNNPRLPDDHDAAFQSNGEAESETERRAALDFESEAPFTTGGAPPPGAADRTGALGSSPRTGKPS